jgi:mono/diheme cytochrome c family protein
MSRGTCGIAGVAVVLLAALVSGADDQAARGAKPTPAAAPASAAAAKPSRVYTDVYNGWKQWHNYCYRCHGFNAIGGALAPSLIGQNQKFTRAEFLKIVREGRPDKGMQSWKELLTDAQIGQIHLYVRARKEKVLPAGRPDEVGPNHSPWMPPAGWPKP